MNEFNLVVIIAAAMLIIGVLQIVFNEIRFQNKKNMDIQRPDPMFLPQPYLIDENGNLKKVIWKDDGSPEIVDL